MTGQRQPAPTNVRFDDQEEAARRVRTSPWARPNGTDPKHAMLLRTIETEVVPRLVLSRRAALQHAAVLEAGPEVPLAPSIEEFASLVLAKDEAGPAHFVDTARAGGTSIEALYLELLAPAARRLGELWEEDLCDFTEVTIGLGRLQQILRNLGPAFLGGCEDFHRGRNALLAPVPGEQHTFGSLMVADFLRRAGWDVWSGTIDKRVDLTSLVRKKWFAVAGISLSTEVQLDNLAVTIRDIRRLSCNRRIGVMVGGPLFIEHPELVTEVGADVTAADGQKAALLAEDLLALLSRSP